MTENSKKRFLSPKFFFVYFIAFSTLILLIFIGIFLSSYWDYWSEVRTMEKYYQSKAKQLLTNKEVPQISQADPVKGGTNATVTIFEFSDFLCPSCQNLQADLLSLEKLYRDKIRFVYKGLPFTISPESRPALLASYCAAEQGKFWEYKDLLFQNQLILTAQKYKDYALALSLDMAKFNDCVNTKKYNALIDENLALALRLQITSVPTIYVNDQKIEGFVNFNTLKSIIDQKLR